MEGLGFTPDEVRQVLTACTPLCRCQDCQETFDESCKLLAAYINALLLEKLHKRRGNNERRNHTSTG